MLRFFSLSLCAICLSGPVLAQNTQLKLPGGTELVDCLFNTGHLSTSTPHHLDLFREPGQDWQVFDQFLNYYHLKPQSVQVMVDNPKRTTFGWTVKRLESKVNHYAPRIEFRVTLLKSNRQASISMRPQGYRVETAWGSCKPVQTIQAGAGGAASSQPNCDKRS
ncbi:hypothetical protein AXZ77_2883 [Thioclava sp. ES.031]|uniref:hypothetical protein n=1 Tax=Thioclava sp. ES.031 TaxID=1798203 RepID=UPI000BF4A18E|nr:hypothetical protein [Thioclava sp. ES.031]PFG64250.1 hypothetical protein AXZ77_2883 [Thioclava sp. ES.031]